MKIEFQITDRQLLSTTGVVFVKLILPMDVDQPLSSFVAKVEFKVADYIENNKGDCKFAEFYARCLI